MARTRGNTWSRVQVAKLIILLAAAIGLEALVLFQSIPRALPQLAAAGAVDGDNPDAVFRAAGRDMLERRGKLDQSFYPRLRTALAREPLSPDPLVYFGLRAMIEGDVRRAEALLSQARARNPRHGLTRLSLMAIYLQTGRPFEASQEIAVVTRLEPRAWELLAPEFARLATNPANLPSIVQAMGDDPVMDFLLQYMAERGADPDLLLKLSSRLPPLSSGQFRGWQIATVRSLVESGRVQQAYALWRRFAGVAGGAAPLIYDSRFEGRPGGPPFNWDLAASPQGAAEGASGGVLDTRYFGRADANLASQMLMLRPGRYRLSFRVEGNAKGQGSKMLWRVTCREGDTVLAELPIEDVTYAPKEVVGIFLIPAGHCQEQWLRLVGRAAEFPTMQTARISDLSLQQAGGGR